MGMQPLVLSLAIGPRVSADRSKLDLALAVLGEFETSVRVRVDHQSGQINLHAINEAALDAALGWLRADVPLEIGDLTVLYRETITRRAAIDSNTSDSGSRIQIALEVCPSHDPLPRLSLARLRRALAPEILSAAAAGLVAVLAAGPLQGFPLASVGLDLIDVDAPHDTSADIIQSAMRRGALSALVQGGAQLLEPLMRLELVTPEMYEGVIRSDLAVRRARLVEEGVAGGVLEMRADVPLVNLFGYARAISAQTQGRGTYRLSFADWAPAASLIPPLPGAPTAAALRRA